MAKGGPIAMTVPRQYRNNRLDRSSTCDASCETGSAPRYLLRASNVSNVVSPWQFYLPTIRTAKTGDTWTSCWIGLSTAKAEELSLWKDVFEICLSRIIPLLQYRPNDGLRNILRAQIIYLPSMIADMVDLYKSYGYHRSTTGIQYDWFTSAPNVYHHLDQFVRLQGCFVPSDAEPDSVAVEIRATSFNSAEMIWHPSYYLSFGGLEIIAVPGRHYTLKPYSHINNPTLTRITYTTSCDWLEWDEKSASFVGIVPMHCCTAELHVTVNAFSVQELDEGVRLKQAIRSRITIKVQVPYAWTRSGLLKSLRLEYPGNLAYSEAIYDSEESHRVCLREDSVRENAPLPTLPPPTEAHAQRKSYRVLRQFVLARQTAPSPSHDKLDQSHKALDESAATAHAVKFDETDDSQDKEESARRNTFP